jgi:hypothetical protein
MNCYHIMDLIQRNLDGDLSANERSIMTAHIKKCPQCADLADRLNRVSFQLDQLPDVKPPVSVVDRLLPELEQSDPEKVSDFNRNRTFPSRKKKRSRVSGPVWRWGGGLAASVLAVAVVAGLMYQGDTPSAPAKTAQKKSPSTSKEESSVGALSVGDGQVHMASESGPTKVLWSPDRRYVARIGKTGAVIQTRDGKVRFRSAAWIPGSQAQAQWTDKRELMIRLHWPEPRGPYHGEKREIDLRNKKEKKTATK